MSSHRNSDDSRTGSSRAVRISVWTFLAVVVAGISTVRDLDAFWPVFAWTMYWQVGEPPDTVRTIRIDVVGEASERREFFPPDLLTHVERPLVESLMEQAFDTSASQSESRRFLVELLTRKLSGAKPETISGWHLEWDVPPLPQSRLFSRDDPDRRVFLGEFLARDYQ